jgi:hypothetical protein
MILNGTNIMAIKQAAWKLRSLGRQFSATNFTDRHGDGPECLKIADELDAIVKASEI